MDEDEQALATEFYAAVQRASNFSDRSMQSKDYKVGVSDLGFCSEYTRRMLAGIPQEFESDALAAFIGTAIGDGVENAIRTEWGERALIQSEVSLRLEADSGRVYNLGGHPDIVDLENGLVIDIKTVNGLSFVKRNGPKQSQQFQRHGYAKALWEMGTWGERSIPLEEIRVANIWFDRSGAEHEAWVHMENFSEQVVWEATEWLDEVVYAYLHEQEAKKEPSYEFCSVWCGHFADCRGGEGNVSGLLEDPDVLVAVDLVKEASRLEAQAKKLKAQANSALKGIEGSTGEFTVKWVHVNGGDVSYTRRPYERLDIRKIR